MLLLGLGVLLGGRRKLLPLPEPVEEEEASETKLPPRPKLVGRWKEVGAAGTDAGVAAGDNVVGGGAAAVVLDERRGRGGGADGAFIEEESAAERGRRIFGLV